MDEKNLCPRLIDYIVLIGRRVNSRLQPHGAPHFMTPKLCKNETTNNAYFKCKSSNTGGVSNPELLRRYPSKNHKDFQLPTDVTYFCQPEGCITIGKYFLNTFYIKNYY